ncbi:MAG TPA: hypothetical protein VFD42_02695, partial [Chloroflexota bacterium]|nr:hypothetical protein [Chloroflexota bacterium]
EAQGRGADPLHHLQRPLGQRPIQILVVLQEQGYPLLSVAGKASGFSGPALFTDAIRALKSLLAAL